MVNALMIGAGEYTSGCVFTASGPASDKPAGVIGITFIDMKRRGKVSVLLRILLFIHKRESNDKKHFLWLVAGYVVVV